MTKEELNKIMAKARLCNRIQEVEVTGDLYLRVRHGVIENPGRIIYIIYLDSENVIIYIPDNVKMVHFNGRRNMIEHLTDAHTKNIKIVGGGENLEVTSEMLYGLGKSKSLDILDLSELDMHKTYSVFRMFSNIRVKTLILSKNMPTRVMNATEMFQHANIGDIIGLEEFKGSIENTKDIFNVLTCNKLDISKLRVELSDIKYLSTNKLIISSNSIDDESYALFNFLRASYQYDIGEVVMI